MRKQASIIFSLRFVRLAFAVLNLSFSAKYFGVSLERDVWLLAFNAIVIFDIALWAPLNDTFRAKFLFIKQEAGEEESLRQTQALLLFISLISVLLVSLIMLFPARLGRMLAPAYDDRQMDALVFMIRVLAPSFLINQFCKILTSILNTYNSYIIPEIAGIITQAFTLLVIIAVAPTLGIVALSISYYAGLFLLILLLIIQLKKFGLNLWSKVFEIKLKQAIPFFLFSLPFFLPHIIAQINHIIEKSLASSSIGAVSILDYSRKFSDIPVDVLIGIFTSMMVPVLTLQFSKKDMQGFLEDFRKIYQFGFIILILIIGILTACPEAIVDFLYKKGTISAISLGEISTLTMYYSWAGFGIFLYHVYGLALLSSNKGKLFAIYGSVAQLIMIIINLSYFGKASIYTFPFSLGISHLVAAGIMACYFPVKSTKLRIITLKYTFSLVALAFIMHYLNKYFVPFHSSVLIIIFNTFVITCTLTSIIFIGRLEERAIIISYFKKWMLPS